MSENYRTIKAALVQRSVATDPTENMRANISAIHEASDAGADLVLLEELHNTPYFCQHEAVENFDLAEEIPGPTTKLLAKVAAETGTVIVASLFERRVPGLFHNTAVVLDSDGRFAGRYRKMHIPDDPGFQEKFYFTPGDANDGSSSAGFHPIETSIGKLGVLICWDQWYPEAARLMALAGAELLLYPTAIGWDSRDDDDEQARQLDAWMTVQRGHAVANGLPLLCCNRCGHEADPENRTPGIDFWGNSFVVGPQGEVIAHAGQEDEILYAELFMDRSESVRRIWPFFRDRRIDSYKNLTKRFID